MQPDSLGFGARLVMALALPWRLLFDGALAARLARASEGAEALPAPEPEPAPEPAPAPEPPPPAAADDTAALQLLAILQREGRLIDFLQEDVQSFGDADVGAAARVVHAGCKKALGEYFGLAPIRSEDEGASVTLPAGFDADENRVTGNVVGEPPYTGTLAHPGWRVTAVRLPTLGAGHDPHVVAPAEIEL
jgi:hypothetical protein